MLPTATGGDGVLVYTLAPSVSAIGLLFDAEALVVSGTPSRPQEPTTYTLTATDEDGDTAELAFRVEVRPDLKPVFGDAEVADQSYKGGPGDSGPGASGGDRG